MTRQRCDNHQARIGAGAVALEMQEAAERLGCNGLLMDGNGAPVDHALSKPNSGICPIHKPGPLMSAGWRDGDMSDAGRAVLRHDMRNAELLDDPGIGLQMPGDPLDRDTRRALHEA